jgi:hypothetical protein
MLGMTVDSAGGVVAVGSFTSPKVGNDEWCSPRHTMSINSTQETRFYITRNDVASPTYQSLLCGDFREHGIVHHIREQQGCGFVETECRGHHAVGGARGR